MTSDQHSQQDLTVKGEAVERIYGNYRDRRYVVDRRYQRKLVWTLEEKTRFIDSIAKGYPVPIILLAENRRGERPLFDIIDGMQRLNALMSFIENEYALDGAFFDLATMAATKALVDTGELDQREPILPRAMCVRIASYTVPLSIYEFSDEGDVDEVFRRINSGGRKLSRQELRIAGSTGHFAQAVRKIASKIRGDVTAADELLLNDMKKISITNRDLPYGIEVDEIFWVKHGVLTKEQVRESRDEEIVADLLAFMVLETPPPSRSEFLDDYFGFGEGETSKQRLEEIELAVQRTTVDVAAADFQRVIDELKLIFGTAGVTFGQLLFPVQPPRAPRYFQVLFLALYKLLIQKRKEVEDYNELIRLLRGSGANIQVPEGGRWGSQDRLNCVNSAAGMYEPAFKDSAAYNPAYVKWITQLENMLTQSYTEQSAYDFKQGLLRLDGTSAIDEEAFDKICRTLVGIANIRKGTTGYVLVGIADKESTFRRVHQLYGITPRVREGFYVTGLEHEAQALGKSLEQMFQLITNRIKASGISEPLREYVARNLKLVRYYEKSVLILESRAQENPSHFRGEHLVRHGDQLIEVQAPDYGAFYSRFQAGL